MFCCGLFSRLIGAGEMDGLPYAGPNTRMNCNLIYATLFIRWPAFTLIYLLNWTGISGTPLEVISSLITVFEWRRIHH